MSPGLSTRTDRDGTGRSFRSTAEALPAEMLENELFSAARCDGFASSGRVADPRFRQTKIGARSLARRSCSARFSCFRATFKHDWLLPLDRSVRLIGTTVLDPDAALASERIRPDFYFALTTLVVRLRPLRERRDELPILAQHMLERANQRGGVQKDGFSPEALAVLSELRLAWELAGARARDRPCPRRRPERANLRGRGRPAGVDSRQPGRCLRTTTRTKPDQASRPALD